MPQANHLVDRHIGKRLLEARTKSGLTEAQAAEQLGVNLSQFRLYENGVKRIQPQHLIRAAEVMQVSLSWFFEDAPAAPPFLGDKGPSHTVARFLSMPEAYELVRHFIAINSPVQRQVLVNFARSLAEQAPSSRRADHDVFGEQIDPSIRVADRP